MTEPCDLSAIEARRLIGEKKLSPLELTRSCIERVEMVNGRVNAVVTIDAEMGLAAAREAEAAVMRGEELGLLHGLPVGIKDLDQTAGLRTTHGSLLFKDDVPAADDPMIANVRAAGGLVFMKTNTPEFGAGANTVNKVFGATGNAFAPDLTCGGSSGGSAVGLATGMFPLATGSDMGGSLRTPASFSGVVGFRPSPGLVPDPASSVALSPFAVLGPMGRSVEDAHLLLRAQLDEDAHDPWSSSDHARIPDRLTGADLSAIRAAISTDLGVAPIEAGIRQTFDERVGIFSSAFAAADRIDPDMAGLHDAFEVLRGIGFVASFEEHLRTKRELLGINVIDNTERALAYSLADVAHAHMVQTRLYRAFVDLFEEADIVISPAVSVTPFPHKERAPAEIDGAAMPTYMRWLAIVYGFTMALASVAVVPCGRDHRGLPFGIQVAGPKGSDAYVLEVALSIERLLASDPRTARAVPDLSRLASA
ncbi:MAG: amidase family protein [Hyphomicrobiaceae bacterium]